MYCVNRILLSAKWQVLLSSSWSWPCPTWSFTLPTWSPTWQNQTLEEKASLYGAVSVPLAPCLIIMFLVPLQWDWALWWRRWKWSLMAPRWHSMLKNFENRLTNHILKLFVYLTDSSVPFSKFSWSNRAWPWSRKSFLLFANFTPNFLMWWETTLSSLNGFTQIIVLIS